MHFWMHTQLHTVGGFFFLHFWGPCGTSWVGSCRQRGEGGIFNLHRTIWTTPSHITITLVHIWAHLLQHKITFMMYLCNTCEVYYKLCKWCWDSELKHWLWTDSYLGESQFKSLLWGQKSLTLSVRRPFKLSMLSSTQSIYTPRPFKSPVRAEYIYSATFIRLLKKKYWVYWLQVCTIRPLHVCRFSGSFRIRSRPVAAYASPSGRNGGNTSCYVIWFNACLCSMPADSRLQMHWITFPRSKQHVGMQYD